MTWNNVTYNEWVYCAEDGEVLARVAVSGCDQTATITGGSFKSKEYINLKTAKAAVEKQFKEKS